MATMTFINLAVNDLEASKDFFKALGYDHNPQFTDENASCVMLNDVTGVMLLVKPYFESFTSKKLADTSTTIETQIALALDSREQVDQFADKALAAGAVAAGDPRDEGFMYGRDFFDLDGHQWSVFYMDMSAMPAE